MAERVYPLTLARSVLAARLEIATDAAALTQRGALTDRQYDILCRRTAGESHGTIGASLGLSRQRVAQIETRTLAIMNAEAEKGDDRS